MNLKKFLCAILVVVLVVAMSLSIMACEAKKSEEAPAPQENEPENNNSQNNQTNAEISEQAINALLTKVASGNYVIENEGLRKITVYSTDLVYFEDLRNDAGFAVMSKDGEVFQGYLEDTLEGIIYLTQGTAMDAAKSKTLNGLSDLANGNIWDLVTNNPEKPLEFSSNVGAIKELVIYYAGYGPQTISLMHNVEIVLNNVNPTEVHIKAEFDSDDVAQIHPDPVDIKVTFGTAANNALAQAWLDNPVYPEAKTNWDDTDLFIFNSLLFSGSQESPIPFLPFASYALTNDESSFMEQDTIIIKEPHATQSNVETYIGLLYRAGYDDVVENGNTYYRKLLSEFYSRYVSIELETDNGLTITEGTVSKVVSTTNSIMYKAQLKA